MKLVKLSEICSFSRGLTYSKSDEVEYSSNIVLRANNIDLASNSLNLNDLRYIKDSIQIKKDKIAKRNSLIICTASGSKSHVGKVALIDEDYGYAFGGFMGQLTPSDNCHPKFLYYVLTSGLFKDFLMSLKDGTNINNLKFSDIENYEVPLPSLEKQHEIVEKLDRAFAEIELIERNLAGQESALAEITAGKLDRVFSKKNEATNNSRQLALSEIARIINGRAYSQPELLKQGPYPVLRVGNFFSNRSWYYSDLELDQDKYCNTGDLLYAWSASFGPRIWDGGKVIYHYHIWKVEEKANLVLREWLYWWFLWDVNQIKEAHGTGSTMMHVTKGAMESRPVQLPSLKVQSQQIREIAELQRATNELESNYNALTENWTELRNVVLASAFEEAVA